MLPGNTTKRVGLRLGENIDSDLPRGISNGPAVSHIACITEIQEAAALRLFQSGSIPVAQSPTFTKAVMRTFMTFISRLAAPFIAHHALL